MLLDPRLVFASVAAVVGYSCYSVWTFLQGQDEEEDTALHFFMIGLGLAVIFWALILGVPTLLALLWSAVLPGYRSRYRHVPGYKGWPLIGNLLDIQESWHGLHEKGAALFGPVFKMWYGAEPHVVAASASTAKQLLTKCSMVPEFPVPLWGDDRQVLLDGLVFAKNMAFHKTLRAAWAPAFNPASLAGYHPVMMHHADRLVKALDEVADSGNSVDLWRLLIKTSMAIVASTGFGVDVDLEVNEPAAMSSSRGRAAAAAKAQPAPTCMGTRVVQAFQVILDASRPSNTGFWLPIFLMLHPSLRAPVRLLANVLPDATMKNLRNAQREIRTIAFALIQQERQLEKEAAKAVKEVDAASRKAQEPLAGIKPGSFLKHLLTFGDKGAVRLSDAEVVANVYAFLGGGAETPANAMAYTIYQLALHPDCEERLLKEVDAATPSQYEYQNMGDAFPYLHACFSESMRTMTPVSKLFREASDDLTLAGTDICVSKGTKFEISLRCAMRDQAAWKEPLEFKPQRFLPGDAECHKPDTSAFMAFGGGQRMCIGHKYAQQLAKLVLAKLYSHYTFELEPGMVPLRVATGISMAPEDGMWVRVHRRRP